MIATATKKISTFETISHDQKTLFFTQLGEACLTTILHQFVTYYKRSVQLCSAFRSGCLIYLSVHIGTSIFSWSLLDDNVDSAIKRVSKNGVQVE